MSTPSAALIQGMFDIIVEGASKMTSQCRDEANAVCSYRRNAGEGACFAGMVLSDEQVRDETGNVFIGGIRNLTEKRIQMGAPLPDYIRRNESFLEWMQSIHDASENWEYPNGGPNREKMRSGFMKIASIYELNTNTVEEFFPA